jgi:glycosyltransferase involved in cell wall biosynthesis
MNTQPLVSIIIPVYNCEKYLKASIESVLAQNYQHREIIVIDDGSTDNSAEVAKSFGSLLSYYTQENSGTAVARNHGIKLAKGDFLAFLDADDLWLENKLELQISALINQPSLDGVFGQVQNFFSPDLSEDLKKRLYCSDELMAGYIPSALLIKQDSFSQVGLFSTQWKLAEFADWMIRAKEVNLKLLNLPNLVVKRRIHSNNKGIDKRQHKIEYAQILKLFLDRQRNKNSP